MHILFYGGCHAVALKKIFQRFAIPSAHHFFTALVNFQLIDAKEPFPYARMDSYDAIVFSPIYNQPGYNTAELMEFCSKRSKKSVPFPWIQWNGYFPSAAKKSGARDSGWGYNFVHQLAAQSKNYQDYVRAVENGLPISEVKSYFDKSTNRLIEDEYRGQMEIKLSEFILQNFKERRLFFTPDHPTMYVYKFLAPLIAEKIGLELDSSFASSGFEPQYGIKLPIFPIVAQQLGLNFVDSDYQHSEKLPGNWLHMHDYLKSIWIQHKKGLLATAVEPTILKKRPLLKARLGPDEYMEIAEGSLIMSDRIEQHIDGHFIVEGSKLYLPWSEAPIVSSEPRFLFGPHWERIAI